MNERLLQFIWQFQYYNFSHLTTIDDQPVQVLYAGQWNRNQGPDFLNARVKIGGTLWAGHVELHLHTADWHRHGHDSDQRYQNVVLHVVWEVGSEKERMLNDFHTIELKDRISNLLLNHYSRLMGQQPFVSCGGQAGQLPDVSWVMWKERLAVERLEQRTEYIEALLVQSSFHWEEVMWWLMARSFGGSVNGAAFEAIARTLPLAMLRRNRHQLVRIEALLLGQAGLLNEVGDEDYGHLLQEEYVYLQHKYQLKAVGESVHFMRMRPGNFPTVRLAQLAVLLERSMHLFGLVKEAETLEEVREHLAVTACGYWVNHYRFGAEGVRRPKRVGGQMLGLLCINAVIPMVFAYGHLLGEERMKEKALDWLAEMPPEDNAVIRGWQGVGVKADNAFDTQALLGLKKYYCDEKRCLDCSIGNALLKCAVV